MASSFGWLHLTDLHIGHSSQGLLLDNVRADLLDDLRWLHQVSGPWDFVFFTGDLTQRGTAEQFARLDGLLAELFGQLQTLGSRPLLVPVPGNHDLVRPAADYRVAFLKQWSNEEVLRRDFFRAPDYRALVDSAFANYRSWFDKLALPQRPGFRAGLLPGDFRLEEGGLGVVGLNTAYLHLNDDFQEGSLALAAEQIETLFPEGIAQWTARQRANLLLTHHPPEWLNPFARELFRAEIAPPGRFALHLLGHLHEPQAQWVSAGGGRAQRRMQGAALFSYERIAGKVERIHGYSAARLALEPAVSIETWPRRAVPRQDGTRAIVADESFELDRSTRSFRDPPRSATIGSAISAPDDVRDEFDFARLNERLAKSRSARMLVMRNRTWLLQQGDRLSTLVRDGLDLEIVLPDPASRSLMAQLASMFQGSAAELAETIRASIGRVLELRAALPAARRAALRVATHASYPPYSAYLFDGEELWYSPYLRRPARLPVFVYRGRLERLVVYEDLRRLPADPIGDPAWRALASAFIASRLGEALAGETAIAARIDQLHRSGARVYAFGGFVRDALQALVRGADAPFRDLDLVVDGPLEHDGEKNHFGGSRWAGARGLKVDCWELGSTFAFRNNLVAPADAEGLLRTTVYRINACTYDLQSRALCGDEALADLYLGRIAFNCRAYLDQYPEYQAFRALDLAERLAFQLDPEVDEFVRATLRRAGEERFSRAVREHRGDVAEARLRELYNRSTDR